VLVLTARGAALSGATLLGDLMVLGAAVCWAAYTIGARPLLAEYSALKVTAMTMLTGTPLLLLAGAPTIAATAWPALPVGAWAGIAYSTILAIVVSYWIWYGSVRRVGAIRTGIYGNLVPVFGVLTAALVLGEPLYPQQALGAGAILCGLWLARR
jgi:drug/metabolite transporter (DMT)-like permease